MNETVTIRKSDVEKLGKDLIKKIDNFLHNDYIINNFPEMKLDQIIFDRSVNKLKDKFESESLDIEEIYHILTGIKLDDEIDGYLYFKKEAYLRLFQVLFVDYTYLEN